MKLFSSFLIFAAAVFAASPPFLMKTIRDVHKRAVYPEEGEVCCRTDRAENCVSPLDQHEQWFKDVN
ncbi:hypothetical protein CCHL11_07992 [Colletotrichum chlorophyti]|uniref:Uncharacterized protein n=1 Tax=Colletotrichum chlorophyti TaxID=708187 RepID=A0A1Q8RM91_9PEZI|nr:hypothetical protein CCHL11_07992 [Colletotrichum chlorophyti]